LCTRVVYSLSLPDALPICVHVPADCVTARPVAVGHGADVERHADAVAGVEARAAHLGDVPAGAEIARAPLGVGLEAAAGEHHGRSEEHTSELSHVKISYAV